MSDQVTPGTAGRPLAPQQPAAHHPTPRTVVCGGRQPARRRSCFWYCGTVRRAAAPAIGCWPRARRRRRRWTR